MVRKYIHREHGKTYVYLVRHAQSKVPHGLHKFNPHIPLSKGGVIQAKALAKRFIPLKKYIDIFICSSQRRAVETAEAVARIIKKRPIKSDDLWEFNKIFWTRKLYRYKYWKHWLKHKSNLKEFNSILKNNPGKVILIVAHGNVIKGILKNKRGLSLKKIKDLDYKNCHITCLKFNGNKLEKAYCINSKEPVLFK